jgi:hypothetical protein
MQLYVYTFSVQIMGRSNEWDVDVAAFEPSRHIGCI